MRDVEAIHHAARRYSYDQIIHWQDAYARMGAESLVTLPGRGTVYTDAARDTFPRYRVLQAILSEVERFVPEDFRSLDEARQLLAAAGDVAQIRHVPFTKKNDPIEYAAAEDERRRFVQFLASLSPEDLANVEPLPFRRVLGGEEVRRLDAEITARWGRWYGGVSDRDDVPPHLILQSTLIDPPRRDALCDLLAGHGVTRLFEMREFDDSFEIDLCLAGFEYTGAEGWWTAAGAEWMLQASHEDSLTVGGAWLVDEVKQRWPDWRDLIYRGWDGQGPPVM